MTTRSRLATRSDQGQQQDERLKVNTAGLLIIEGEGGRKQTCKTCQVAWSVELWMMMWVVEKNVNFSTVYR